MRAKNIDAANIFAQLEAEGAITRLKAGGKKSLSKLTEEFLAEYDEGEAEGHANPYDLLDRAVDLLRRHQDR